MAYNSWSVVAFEQPTAAKWNILGANDAALRDGSGILVNNNQPITGEEADGTDIDLIKTDSSDDLQVGDTSQAGHTVINAGSGKLTKVKVLRQDNTANSYKGNSVLLTGWDSITGDGTNRRIVKTVTFGITFSEVPLAVTSAWVNASSATASDPGDTSNLTASTTGDMYVSSQGKAATTSVVIGAANVRADGGVGAILTTSQCFVFHWYAIGQLN